MSKVYWVYQSSDRNTWYMISAFKTLVEAEMFITYQDFNVYYYKVDAVYG